MDETEARTAVMAHGAAVIAGDSARALVDIDEPLRRTIGALVATLPQPTTGYEILSIEPSGEGTWAVHIRYSGGGSTTTIRQVWKVVGGRPAIVAASPA